MSDGVGEVHEIPLEAIQRPLESFCDMNKVDSLCETLNANPSLVPPVTVLWITMPLTGNNYYFGFGGCHRYTAYKKLGRKCIPAILQIGTVETLRSFMGASTPELK